ncbi:MAG: HEPN domain-containing protein [Anaerolineae bacterium]
MSDWHDMAQEAIDAAGVCLRRERPRSAASRSYYAMYAAITDALIAEGMRPPAGRESWPHRRMPKLVTDHLQPRLGRGKAIDMRRMVGAAYKIRILADYAPSVTVDSQTAKRCLSDATAVLRHLGVSR